jgi:hypothetical protein
VHRSKERLLDRLVFRQQLGGRSMTSLRFRSGFTARRDRKPAPGMAEFGVLEPPLRLSVLNRGTDFALV